MVNFFQAQYSTKKEGEKEKELIKRGGGRESEKCCCLCVCGCSCTYEKVKERVSEIVNVYVNGCKVCVCMIKR